MWDVKVPTRYSKRVGHEFPGVVAVLCECMGRYSEGDNLYLVWDLESSLYSISPCTSVQKLLKNKSKNKELII